MAQNIYFEARGESTRGQYAVAHVTYNRANYDLGKVCGIVHAKSQFSWTLQKDKLRITDKVAWEKAMFIAEDAYYQPDFTNRSVFYHANYMTPDWDFSKLVKTMTIGGHTFYRRKGKQ